MNQLFLLVYIIIAIPVLLAALSWRVTGQAKSVFKLSLEQKSSLILPVIALAIIGLPLFLSGLTCSLFWSGSAIQIYLEPASAGGYGYSWNILGLIIALPSALIGFFVSRYLWRLMRGRFISR